MGRIEEFETLLRERYKLMQELKQEPDKATQEKLDMVTEKINLIIADIKDAEDAVSGGSD